MLAIERCHLSIEAIVATPYAGGLSALVDDEAEIGATLVDMGGGTTSTGVFERGHLTHVDTFAVGGNHVTLDIARGLTTRMGDAERLKTLHGTAMASTSDDREIISVTQVGDDADHATHVPKSQLVRIIKPRVEEILELVRDRLEQAGYATQGRRVILTGGASQLQGVAEVARRIISPHVRIGRPLGIQGLPESAKNPAFTAAVGLLIYPQVAGVEHFEPRGAGVQKATGTDGYMGKVGRWLKDNF
jgi:cell division protein FtsA